MRVPHDNHSKRRRRRHIRVYAAYTATLHQSQRSHVANIFHMAHRKISIEMANFESIAATASAGVRQRRWLSLALHANKIVIIREDWQREMGATRIHTTHKSIWVDVGTAGTRLTPPPFVRVGHLSCKHLLI